MRSPDASSCPATSGCRKRIFTSLGISSPKSWPAKSPWPEALTLLSVSGQDWKSPSPHPEQPPSCGSRRPSRRSKTRATTSTPPHHHTTPPHHNPTPTHRAFPCVAHTTPPHHHTTPPHHNPTPTHRAFPCVAHTTPPHHHTTPLHHHPTPTHRALPCVAHNTPAHHHTTPPHHHPTPTHRAFPCVANTTPPHHPTPHKPILRLHSLCMVHTNTHPAHTKSTYPPNNSTHHTRHKSHTHIYTNMMRPCSGWYPQHGRQTKGANGPPCRSRRPNLPRRNRHTRRATKPTQQSSRRA